MDDHTKLPARIAAKIAPDPESGCWEWTGEKNLKGYGRVRWNGPKVVAHRLTYNLLVDSSCPLMPGRSNTTVLDHVSCDNKSCVNPAHLQLTSHRVNHSRRKGSSVYVGVSWCQRDSVWRAHIRDGSHRSLGSYRLQLDAAAAYDNAREAIDGTRPNGTPRP